MSTEPITTNEEWLEAIGQVLGQYVTGQAVSTRDAPLLSECVVRFGAPPEPVEPITYYDAPSRR